MTAPPPELVLVADALFTPAERLAAGWVHVRDGRIVAAGEGTPPADAPAVRLPRDRTIAPGFIDLHVHGGGGAQVGPDPHGVAEMARFHARHGTTGLLATTVPAAVDELVATVRAVAAGAARRPHPDAACVLGCHLEGPFVSPDRAGALDPRHLRPPDLALLDRLLDAGAGSVQTIVVAPELPGALELIAAAAGEGVRGAIGHTDATYEQALAAFDRGARAVTHLFNAMRPLDHREPGVVGAALATPRVTAELIADGIHLHPSALRIAHAAKGPDRLALVTDATQAAGLPDGDHALGGRRITVVGGEARTPEGSLAGSTLTMDRAVQVCVEQAGIPLPDALTMASATPAALLGLGRVKGRIAPGADADLVVLDGGWRAVGTMIAGRWAHADAALSRLLGGLEAEAAGRAGARARP
jgi:N-acetylglucosamine-6-phosphate deacetylase